jgi:aminocarboxymuconate-semialdehyde decarboxylase
MCRLTTITWTDDDVSAPPGRPVIDVHAHVVLEGTFGAAGPEGPELVCEAGREVFRSGGYRLEGVRYRGTAFLDVDLRLAAMEAAGIEYQVLSPNPLTYFHHIDTPLAEQYCVRHNDLLAEMVAAHPDRLGGLAALPMQDPDRAAAELERAVRELGLLGAGIGTDVGRPLDDPALDRFYAAAAALDVPLFLHPGPASAAGTGDPRLARFDLELTVGFAAEEALAVATLIYGGVVDRHPMLDICISHGGGGAAFLYGRLRQAARVRAWASPALAADGGFEAAFGRLWFDCLVHDDRALGLLLDVVGEERLVPGTNFAGWDQGLPPAEGQLRQRLSANARRLLRLDRPPPPA